jgi:hypothetical protein
MPTSTNKRLIATGHPGAGDAGRSATRAAARPCRDPTSGISRRHPEDLRARLRQITDGRSRCGSSHVEPRRARRFQRRGARSAASSADGTTITGRSACGSMACDTLPSSTDSTSLSPRVPSTTAPASMRSASLRIVAEIVAPSSSHARLGYQPRAALRARSCGARQKASLPSWPTHSGAKCSTQCGALWRASWRRCYEIWWRCSDPTGPTSPLRA